MKWSSVIVTLFGLVCAGRAVALVAAPPAALAGRWTLNRDLSQFPKEVAFGIDVSDGGSAGGRGGGRQGGGRRGGGGSSGDGGGAFSLASLRETEEDANKIKELIADAKNPSPVLTIAQTDSVISITDAQDRTRRFHPNDKEETEPLDAGPVGATARWNGPQLAIQFKIRKDRLFRYTYSRLPSGQLLVETRLDDGRSRDIGNVIRRVYDSE